MAGGSLGVSRAISLPEVNNLQDEYVVRGNALNVIRIMVAVNGSAAVTIRDHDSAIRRLPWGKAFHLDELAGRICPTFQPGALCHSVHLLFAEN